jgi:hypothetical protein
MSRAPIFFFSVISSVAAMTPKISFVSESMSSERVTSRNLLSSLTSCFVELEGPLRIFGIIVSKLILLRRAHNEASFHLLKRESSSYISMYSRDGSGM